MSYYVDEYAAWNSRQAGINSPEEQTCSRCRGLGTDRDGADCVFCEGWGSVEMR